MLYEPVEKDKHESCSNFSFFLFQRALWLLPAARWKKSDSNEWNNCKTKKGKNLSLRRENSSYCYHRPDLAWFCFLSLMRKIPKSTIIAAFNVVIDFQLVSLLLFYPSLLVYSFVIRCWLHFNDPSSTSTPIHIIGKQPQSTSSHSERRHESSLCS